MDILLNWFCFSFNFLFFKVCIGGNCMIKATLFTDCKKLCFVVCNGILELELAIVYLDNYSFFSTGLYIPLF